MLPRRNRPRTGRKISVLAMGLALLAIAIAIVVGIFVGNEIRPAASHKTDQSTMTAPSQLHPRRMRSHSPARHPRDPQDPRLSSFPKSPVQFRNFALPHHDEIDRIEGCGPARNDRIQLKKRLRRQIAGRQAAPATILLIDDDPAVLESLRRVLATGDWAVVMPEWRKRPGSAV